MLRVLGDYKLCDVDLFKCVPDPPACCREVYAFVDTIPIGAWNESDGHRSSSGNLILNNANSRAPEESANPSLSQFGNIDMSRERWIAKIYFRQVVVQTFAKEDWKVDMSIDQRVPFEYCIRSFEWILWKSRQISISRIAKGAVTRCSPD